MGIWIIMAVCVLGFAVLGLINWWDHRGAALSGSATVVSRRVEYGRAAGSARGSSNWNYYITFRLLDGEEMELSAMKYHYDLCKEGMTGMVKWNREHLYDFECDEVT